MGRYNIGGIVLEFDYVYDRYFQDNIHAYEVDAAVPIDAVMRVELVEKLEEPIGDIILEKNHKVLYQDKEYYYLTYYNEDKTKPHTLIIYKEDYTEVTIQMISRGEDVDAEFEYITTGLFFLSLAYSLHSVSLHASAICYHEEAILFSAPSQTGKSTLARAWKEVYNDVEIINDDKPLLIFNKEGIYVSGTPWSGKMSQNKNIMVPLKAIVFLEQGKDNTIVLLSDKEKITHLLRNVHRPHEKELQDVLFTQIHKLIEQIPMVVYQLNQTKEAVTTLEDYLYKGEE